MSVQAVAEQLTFGEFEGEEVTGSTFALKGVKPSPTKPLARHEVVSGTWVGTVEEITFKGKEGGVRHHVIEVSKAEISR
jgi:hypothetical protein